MVRILVDRTTGSSAAGAERRSDEYVTVLLAETVLVRGEGVVKQLVVHHTVADAVKAPQVLLRLGLRQRDDGKDLLTNVGVAQMPEDAMRGTQVQLQRRNAKRGGALRCRGACVATTSPQQRSPWCSALPCFRDHP